MLLGAVRGLEPRRRRLHNSSDVANRNRPGTTATTMAQNVTVIESTAADTQ